MKGTIKKHTHFKFIMKHGEQTVLRSCVIYVLSNEKFFAEFKRYTKSVYGIMATKKLGDAVERNFIKRRLRHALHGVDFTGKSIVFVARKQCETLPFERIRAEVATVHTK